MIARSSTGGAEPVADVGQERHEAGALDGILDGALEGGAVASALAGEHLTLVVAELLQRRHVLVVHERGARAALLRAEPAAVLAPGAELLADHLLPRFVGWYGEGDSIRAGPSSVHRPGASLRAPCRCARPARPLRARREGGGTGPPGRGRGRRRRCW